MPWLTSIAKAPSISLAVVAFAVTKRSPRVPAAVAKASIEGSSTAGNCLDRRDIRKIYVVMAASCGSTNEDLGMVKKIEHYPELMDPQVRPRYSGIPTFFRLPHTERLNEVDIGIIGVPFDGGVTNRPGARHGPRDIRNQSSLIRKINQATGVAPFELVRVADLGDAWIERPFELEGAHVEINAFFTTVHTAGVTPLSVGGDHSISLPILRAIARNGPLGLVHVDAHCDTGDDYLGSRFHHGASFRRAVEERLIDPKRVIQIGIRGSLNQADMWQFSHDQGMRVVSIEEFHDKGWRWAAEEARVIVDEGPAYFSFDIDALDPAYALGTGTPEPGGLTTFEAQRLIRELGSLDLVGADLVEVSPPLDTSGMTSMTAVAILFELLCVLAQARVRRKPASSG
jgi:guanidinopropionase